MSATQFKFKKLKKPFCTDDPYYDLFNGRIPVEKMINKETAVKVIEAINLLETFLDLAEEANVLEVV